MDFTTRESCFILVAAVSLCALVMNISGQRAKHRELERAWDELRRERNGMGR